MPSLAIIGTGIAGLGCADFLQRDYDLTIFEQNDYVGGHTNTVSVDEPATPSAPRRSVAMDTGFMVFNKVTYPHLSRLFATLDVAIKPTSMSFSVRHAESGLEFRELPLKFSDSGVAGVAQGLAHRDAVHIIPGCRPLELP